MKEYEESWHTLYHSQLDDENQDGGNRNDLTASPTPLLYFHPWWSLEWDALLLRH
jgi:hypothetical protein